MSSPSARDERQVLGAAPSGATEIPAAARTPRPRGESQRFFSFGSPDPKIESGASAESTLLSMCIASPPFFAISSWPWVVSLIVPYAGHRFRNDDKPQTATSCSDEAGGSADSPTAFPCHRIDTASVGRERKDRHEGVSCSFLERISMGRPFHCFWA